MHAFNPSTGEGEAGSSLGVPGQPGLQMSSRTFKDIQGHTEKPCLTVLSLENSDPRRYQSVHLDHLEN